MLLDRRAHPDEARVPERAQTNFTDSESRIMSTPEGFQQSYNACFTHSLGHFNAKCFELPGNDTASADLAEAQQPPNEIRQPRAVVGLTVCDHSLTTIDPVGGQ